MAGIPITGTFIKGAGDAGQFAINTADSLKIPIQIVADITARDAFVEFLRMPYMLVYVIATTDTYRLGTDITIAGQVWTLETGNYILTSAIGAANGVAPLDASSKIPSQYLNQTIITDVHTAADLTAMFALTTFEGNLIIVTDASADPLIVSGSATYVKLNDNAPTTTLPDFSIIEFAVSVTSINGKTGIVTLDFDDINAVTPSQFTAAVAADVVVLANAAGVVANANDITTLTSDKANKTNVLELNNTSTFTPTADYQPATKKYVDDEIGAIPSGTPGGNTTEVQVNLLGVFTGYATLTYAANILTTANLNISSAPSQDDALTNLLVRAGDGTIKYRAVSSLPATVGGADTQVQFNDGGVFGGDSTFAFNKTTNVLTVDSVLITTLTGDGNGLTLTDADAAGIYLISDGTINLTDTGGAIFIKSEVGDDDANLIMGPNNVALNVENLGFVPYKAGIVITTADGMTYEATGTASGFAGYGGDYSVDFTARSWIDKGYADATYQSIGGRWPLTGTAALTGATTINTGTNTLLIRTNIAAPPTQKHGIELTNAGVALFSVANTKTTHYIESTASGINIGTLAPGALGTDDKLVVWDELTKSVQAFSQDGLSTVYALIGGNSIQPGTTSVNGAIQLNSGVGSTWSVTTNAQTEGFTVSNETGGGKAVFFTTNTIFAFEDSTAFPEKVHFTDNRVGAAAVGIEYTVDYSSNFVDRSLVDKAYVDSVAGPGGSTTEIQYNNAGVLTGSVDFIWTQGSNLLTIDGSITLLNASGGGSIIKIVDGANDWVEIGPSETGAAGAIFLGDGVTSIAISADTTDAAYINRSFTIGANTAPSANTKLRLGGIPTSSSGLATGDVWSNLGVLTIV